MTFKSVLNWLNPMKPAWYYRSEWVGVDSEYAIDVLQKNDCPSWDIELVKVKKYKHKHSCETRKRAMRPLALTKTVFEDPHEFETPKLSEMDLYEGGTYE